MSQRASIIFFVFTLLSFMSLSPKWTSPYWEKPQVKFPEDNPYSEESIKLGGDLFFSSLFSRDSSISCQSCHMLTETFADHLPKGEGIKGRHVERNTPTLFNIGLHPYFMFDGKFSSLEDQVLAPIKEHREFDMTPELVVQRLQSIPIYNEMSQAAYGKDISIDVIQKALANFQRVIISDKSKFDKFMRKEVSLSEEEQKGWELFQSPALNCNQCHSGYNFTNYEFENNGLYEEYEDRGRFLITKDSNDLAKFKIPTLRNIAITFPYMHNGSLSSLEEVIDHYASGGGNHSSKSNFIKGFKISTEERSFLIAFLNTLTEERLLNKD